MTELILEYLVKSMLKKNIGNKRLYGVRRMRDGKKFHQKSSKDKILKAVNNFEEVCNSGKFKFKYLDDWLLQNQ